MSALLRCRFLPALFSGGLTCSPVLSNPPASAFLLLEIQFVWFSFCGVGKKIQFLIPSGKGAYAPLNHTSDPFNYFLWKLVGPWGGRRDSKTVLTVLVKVDRGSNSTEKQEAVQQMGHSRPLSDNESE